MGQKNSKGKRAASLTTLQGQTVTDASGRTRSSVTETIEAFWWDFVEPKRQEIGEAIYLKFFMEHPEYRKIFTQQPLKRHAASLMHMLSSLIQGLNDLKTLDKKIRELGERHISYNVPRGAFSHMTEAVVSAMQEVFGADFTHSVRFAFIETLNLCMGLMIEEIGDQTEMGNLQFHNPEKYPVLQPRKFGEFLRDAECMSYFELYLARQQRRQLVLFRDAVTKWVKMHGNMTPTDRRLQAQGIVAAYFDDESSLRVDVIDADAVTTLRAEVQKEEVQDSVFEDCLHLLHLYLRDNMLEPFRQSRYCQALISAKFEEGDE